MDPNHDDFKTVTKELSGDRTDRAVHFRLQIVHPAELLGEVLLGTEPVVLGRKPDEATMPRLRHATVSRSHAEITWDPQQKQHRVKDLGSHNGTRLNGEPVGDQWQRLNDGTVIQFGDVLTIYEKHAGLLGPTQNEVSHDQVPGKSGPIQALRNAIGRASGDPSPVLLIGETGTGKEWIAKEVHRLSGRSGQLVPVNCSTLNALIIESQLFGHVRGSFTGASTDQSGVFRDADGGTLFLDEIGELPLELQPKLLRAIQERKVQPIGSSQTIDVDVRIVAATNRRLDEMVERGEFRRDLYARLALWQLEVPALRQRKPDLVMWFERLHQHWLEQRGEQSTKPLTLTASAAEAIVLHDWKDNLRGMDRLIHELAGRQELKEQTISLDDLPEWLTTDSGSAAIAKPPPPEASSNSAVDVEKAMPTASRPAKPTRDEFVATYESFEGSVHALARHYGRDRRQIYRWVHNYGLSDTRKPED